MRVIAVEELLSDDHSNVITRRSKDGYPVRRRRPRFMITLELDPANVAVYKLLPKMSQKRFRATLGCATFSKTSFVCAVDKKGIQTAEEVVKVLIKAATDTLKAL